MRPALRKWMLRLSVAVVTLLVVAVVTVQVVLSTDVPRRVVVAQLQSQLQLRVTAGSLSTGWFGHTTLRDVTMSLPLAKESFLQVPVLSVSHTTLPGLLMGRDIHIDELAFDRPDLVIRQGKSGRWNVQDVVELLRRAAGGQQGANESVGQPGKSLVLPAVRVRDGVLHVIDRNDREARVTPLNADCGPDGPLVWGFSLDAGGDQLHVTGRLVPGGAWEHTLSLSVNNLGPTLAPWTGALPAMERSLIERAVFKGDWQGLVQPTGKVGGLLTLDRLTTGDKSPEEYSALGAFAVDAGGSMLRLLPQNVTVHGLPNVPSDVKLQTGAIVMDGSGIQITGLSGLCAGGRVWVDQTHVGFADGAADLNMRWQDINAPRAITQSGSLIASLRSPWPGQPLIHAELSSTGAIEQGAEGKWDTRLKVDGRGTSWSTIDWQAVVDRLRVERRRQAANFDGLGIKLEQRNRSLKLASIDLPAGGVLSGSLQRGSLTGQGSYDLDQGIWSIHLAGDSWRTAGSMPARFNLDAAGDRDGATLSSSHLVFAGLQYSAEGDIRFNRAGRPVRLAVHADYPPFNLDLYHSNNPFQGGEFFSELVVNGTTEPVNLDATGSLNGSDLRLRGRKLGDFHAKEVHLIAREILDTNGASHGVQVVMAPSKLSLFEGTWTVSGQYDSAANSAEVDVQLMRMSMRQLDDFVSPPPSVDGVVSGSWKVRLPGLDLDRMQIDGPVQVSGLKAPHFVADHVDGMVNVDQGIVNLRDVVVRRQFRGTERRLNASAQLPLLHPERVTVSAVAVAWPALPDEPDVDLDVFGQIDKDLQLDFGNGGGLGSITLDVHTAYQQQDTGILHVKAMFRGRLISAKVNGDVLGGTLAAIGAANLDDLLKSHADVTLNQLDAGQLSPLFGPRLRGLEGRYSGTAIIAPPSNPRPLAPLEVQLRLTNSGGKYRTVPIGPIDLALYYDDGKKRDEYSEGNERLLLDGSSIDPQTGKPMGIEVAQGDARPWARLTRHPGDRLWATQVNLQVDKLDLDQIVHAVEPQFESIPGKLSGHVMFAGEPRDKRRFFGEGDMSLTQSNLANFSVVSALYDLLSVKLGSEPTGYGDIAVRLEEDTMNITQFHYFNRGVEVRATGNVFEIWKMPKSPTDIYAVASIRPLKDLKLPFIGDVDQVLAALQGNFATEHATGPFDNLKLQTIPFAGISNALRELILGDVRPVTDTTGTK